MNLLFETYDDNKKHDDRDVADADFVMKDDSSNVSRNENSNTEKLDVNTNTS